MCNVVWSGAVTRAALSRIPHEEDEPCGQVLQYCTLHCTECDMLCTHHIVLCCDDMLCYVKQIMGVCVCVREEYCCPQLGRAVMYSSPSET